MEKPLIYYSYFAHATGHFLVGATAQGLAFAGVDAHEQPHAKRILNYYPAAILQRDNMRLVPYLRIMQQHLEGIPAPVALDTGGTGFQRRIWETLRRIPYGETISYQELARLCGNPSAVRACAGACGANPICVVTPCHRVLRKNGELGGFAYGLEVKQALLDYEAAQASRTSRLSA